MSGEKRICLTFDDGPSEYTENLLDGLAERNAK
ncbi:MAG: polysaccharide deacetylase family protein, partial [Solobacterium sp.]|nr:polysaccharide deacetylase family protein [Solobacterium sp.]